MEVVGTFSLQSFSIENTNRELSPWGEGSNGLLIYSTRHVSVAINKEVIRDGSQTETDDIFDSILFYAGTYTVEGTTIRHQVTNASNPARIGKEMIRYAEWNGDLLTLTTPQESFGRAILVWKKIG